MRARDLDGKSHERLAPSLGTIQSDRHIAQCLAHRIHWAGFNFSGTRSVKEKLHSS